MRIYINDVPDVDIESPISIHQLVVLVDAWQTGIAHSQIYVIQGDRKGRIDVADIDLVRTCPNVVFTNTEPPSPPDTQRSAS